MPPPDQPGNSGTAVRPRGRQCGGLARHHRRQRRPDRDCARPARPQSGDGRPRRRVEQAGTTLGIPALDITTGAGTPSASTCAASRCASGRAADTSPRPDPQETRPAVPLLDRDRMRSAVPTRRYVKRGFAGNRRFHVPALHRLSVVMLCLFVTGDAARRQHARRSARNKQRRRHRRAPRPGSTVAGHSKTF